MVKYRNAVGDHERLVTLRFAILVFVRNLVAVRVGRPDLQPPILQPLRERLLNYFWSRREDSKDGDTRAKEIVRLRAVERLVEARDLFRREPWFRKSPQTAFARHRLHTRRRACRRPAQIWPLLALGSLLLLTRAVAELRKRTV